MLAVQLLFLTGILAARQAAAHQDVGPTITTSARGELKLPPDVAVVRIGVASRASTAAAAATESARRVRAVTDTLRRMRLAPELAEPVALQVHTNEAVAQGRLVDYEASALVTVRVREFERLGSIVDAALAAGATTIPGVRFDSDTAASARRHALARAYEDAAAKAQVIARAAGVSLGPLVELRTGHDYDYELDDELLFGDMPFGRGRSTRREVPVSAMVTATWRIADRRE